MSGCGEVINENVNPSPWAPPKISSEDNWTKELGSEVARGGKDSQQTQSKTIYPIFEKTGRPVLSEQQFGSSVQEMVNVSYLTAEAPMNERGHLFSSCASAC